MKTNYIYAYVIMLSLVGCSDNNPTSSTDNNNNW